MKIEYLSLEDVCERIVDCPHESPEWRDQGIHVIRNFNLVDGQIDLSDSYYVDEETYRKRIQRAVPQAGDIIFSREAPIGNCAIIPDGFKCCLGQRLVLMRVNKAICSSEYLLAALMSDYVKCQIDQVSRSGSIVSNFNIGDLKKLVIPVVENMESVAKTSALLNAKLSLNKQLCSQLESMAKTLYDYWFVQFDFPDANGKPYRASGGEMVWNDQLKREIPKGWEIASINAMTTSYRGVSYDKNDLLPSSENGVLVLRGNNIQNNRLVYDRNVAYVPHSFVSKEQQIRAHDIILTMSSGSKEHIGKCTRFQYDSPHTYGAFLTKFTPDTDKVGFVYLSMISEFFKKKIKAICNGTGINNLTNETFDNLVFPNPTASVLKQFEKTVAPILEKMGSCEKENETLISLRDWLLPMLMNGQATVAPAESPTKLQVLQPEKPTRDPRFDRWLQTQGVAARGTVDEQTLHDIFDAMDDDDKQ